MRREWLGPFIYFQKKFVRLIDKQSNQFYNERAYKKMRWNVFKIILL